MQTNPLDEKESLSVSSSFLSSLDPYRARLDAMEDAPPLWTRGLDVQVAVGIVNANFARIRLLREAVAEQFGEAAAARLDELPRLAEATRDAHFAWVASRERVVLSVLHTALREEHALLWGDAQSLANRKVIAKKRLALARSTHGYEQTILSVHLLLVLFREALNAGVNTPIRWEDLKRIEAKAQYFFVCVSVRALRKDKLPAKETRKRMLTLLLREYDEVRRMLHFIRWHEDDADAIAPSLWIKTGRSKRRKKRARNRVPNDT